MEEDTQDNTTEGTVVAINMPDLWKVKVVEILEGACIILFTSWVNKLGKRFNIGSSRISGLNINIDITSTPLFDYMYSVFVIVYRMGYKATLVGHLKHLYMLICNRNTYMILYTCMIIL